MKKNKKKAKKTSVRNLTFAELRDANVRRCNKYFHPLKKWSATDWGCALSGEVGELCNFLKKIRRGQKIPVIKLAKELGDIICYADLLAARLGIDLTTATRNKFNEVSRRKKSDITL